MAQQMALEIVTDNMPKLAKGLKQLAGTSVEVGVPAAKGTRKGAGGTEEINNAALAYIHDNGSPAMNIPARPFMQPGINDGKAEITRRMAQAGDAALDGRDPLPALNAVGLVAQNHIRARINDNTPPPLQPATIAARKRRGITTTRTLVVTGKLRNSISYVVIQGRKS
jgi:hypothetical protein